jgi:hypothetical protein
MTENYKKLHVFGPSGKPTGAEVGEIMNHYPSLRAGDTISHVDIAALIHIDPDSARYRSVTTAWRKRMYREFNTSIAAVPNEGFVVLDGHERVNLASSKMKSGIRRIANSGDLAQRTEKAGLTNQELKACDHLVRVRAMMLDAHASQARQLRVELKGIRERE